MELDIEFEDTAKMVKTDLLKYVEKLEEKLLEVTKLLAEKDKEKQENEVVEKPSGKVIDEETLIKLHKLSAMLVNDRTVLSPAGKSHMLLLHNIITRLKLD